MKGKSRKKSYERITPILTSLSSLLAVNTDSEISAEWLCELASTRMYLSVLWQLCVFALALCFTSQAHTSSNRVRLSNFLFVYPHSSHFLVVTPLKPYYNTCKQSPHSTAAYHCKFFHCHFMATEALTVVPQHMVSANLWCGHGSSPWYYWGRRTQDNTRPGPRLLKVPSNYFICSNLASDIQRHVASEHIGSI